MYVSMLIATLFRLCLYKAELEQNGDLTTQA